MENDNDGEDDDLVNHETGKNPEKSKLSPDRYISFLDNVTIDAGLVVCTLPAETNSSASNYSMAQQSNITSRRRLLNRLFGRTQNKSTSQN